MTRPPHLPDYHHPPLHEVVLGVQFAPVPGYSSVNAQSIWALFENAFPSVQEQSLLPPQFETFGGTNLQPSFQFEVGAPPVGSRLWFISDDGNHLVQFQPDRFLANWRKQPNSQPYPRFERIAESFETNISTLAAYLSTEFSYAININQAEVSYLNIIPVDDFSNTGQWFSLLNSGQLNIETININFTEVVKGDDGKPFARLHHEIQTVFALDGKHKALRLNLTFRGKPVDGEIKSAMNFLAAGREAIVNRFTAITTPHAHETWGRML